MTENPPTPTGSEGPTPTATDAYWMARRDAAWRDLYAAIEILHGPQAAQRVAWMYFEQTDPVPY